MGQHDRSNTVLAALLLLCYGSSLPEGHVNSWLCDSLLAPLKEHAQVSEPPWNSN